MSTFTSITQQNRTSGIASGHAPPPILLRLIDRSQVFLHVALSLQPFPEFVTAGRDLGARGRRGRSLCRSHCRGAFVCIPRFKLAWNKKRNTRNNMGYRGQNSVKNCREVAQSVYFLVSSLGTLPIVMTARSMPLHKRALFSQHFEQPHTNIPR